MSTAQRQRQRKAWKNALIAKRKGLKCDMADSPGQLCSMVLRRISPANHEGEVRIKFAILKVEKC